MKRVSIFSISFLLAFICLSTVISCCRKGQNIKRSSVNIGSMSKGVIDPSQEICMITFPGHLWIPSVSGSLSPHSLWPHSALSFDVIMRINKIACISVTANIGSEFWTDPDLLVTCVLSGNVEHARSKDSSKAHLPACNIFVYVFMHMRPIWLLPRKLHFAWKSLGIMEILLHVSSNKMSWNAISWLTEHIWFHNILLFAPALGRWLAFYEINIPGVHSKHKTELKRKHQSTMC